MNKPWSIALGWGSLTLAAGIGYYFAKKDINARHREQMKHLNHAHDKLEWWEKVALDEEKNKSNKDLNSKINHVSSNNDSNKSLKHYTSDQPTVQLKQKDEEG